MLVYRSVVTLCKHIWALKICHHGPMPWFVDHGLWCFNTTNEFLVNLPLAPDTWFKFKSGRFQEHSLIHHILQFISVNMLEWFYFSKIHSIHHQQASFSPHICPMPFRGIEVASLALRSLGRIHDSWCTCPCPTELRWSSAYSGFLRWGGTERHSDEKLWLPVLAGWWFQIFVIFIRTWGNDPIWLIFFKRVETTT